MSSTIVVTGSAGGMTSLAIRQLVASLPSSTHFILLVRNPSTVSEGVLPPSSVNVELVALDLADLSSCQTIGSEIASRVQSGGLPPISALVESAAMQDVRGPSPKLTEDSYETTFAINYLSHFILTQALLPAMDRKEGRVVIVGSDAYRNDNQFFRLPAKYEGLEKMVKLEEGSDEKLRQELKVGHGDIGLGRYATSKLLQTMVAQELSRRLSQNPQYSLLRIVVWEPGSMGGTGMFRTWTPFARRLTNVLFSFPRLVNFLWPALNVSLPADSAAMLVRVVTEKRFVDGDVGRVRYFRVKGNKEELKGQAADEELCRELWDDSVRLLGVE